MVMFLIICHICACVFIYIGTRVPEWNLGQMNQISWIIADPSLKGTVYSRDEHFAMKPDSSGILRYLLSFYWVLSTITGDGMIGPLTPQNFIEILYTIILMAINLTIYSWISGELANMVMNADNRVIRRREEQDRYISSHTHSHAHTFTQTLAHTHLHSTSCVHARIRTCRHIATHSCNDAMLLRKCAFHYGL